MATHLIATPTTATTVRPGTGWDSLSAAFTAEAEPIAGRDDLTVTIAPGAGHGSPGVFIPSRAAIEINSSSFPVNPATATPHRASDRNRYPVAWGVFTHECGHAAHSRWHPPVLADPAVAEAADLLEETRMEAAQVRRRPDDRHWLAASATEIVIGDEGGAATVASLPSTEYDAARMAGLVLGRIDAGVLTPADCEPVAAEAEKILGPEKLAALREIWRQAHTVADDDGAAMLELGQQWVDLVGRNPHADPTPGSVLASAIVALGENIARRVRENPLPPDPAELAADAADAEAKAEHAAARAAEKIFGPDHGHGDGGRVSRRASRAPQSDEHGAARVLAQALNTASARERTVVRTTSAVPPGRLRMRGVVAREAQRAAGAIPTAEPFTRTARKVTPTPPLRIGIACDVSGSMSAYADAVASAAWIIARAAELATMPAATATVTFGSKVEPIVYPGTAPKRVTTFTCPDNQEKLTLATDALDGALGLSRPGATRLLVVISDGVFWPREHTTAEKRLDRLRATGCAVLWLTPATFGTTPFGYSATHELHNPSGTARAIGRAAVAAVRKA